MQNQTSGSASGPVLPVPEVEERFIAHVLQLAHPVREAEDLAGGALPEGERISVGGLAAGDADALRGAEGKRPVAAGVLPPVLLDLARNPYDFWPLITQAHREWAVGSDALIDGAPLPDALGLLREGFRRMKLELLLGALAGEVAALPGGLRRVPASRGLTGQEDLIQERVGVHAGDVSIPCLLDVVSIHRGWLQGHLLWVRPDLRGQGLVGGYFDAALRLAKERGLYGMHFTSTLPFWERRAPRYGFSRGITIKQRIGPPAVGWYREV